MAELPDLGKHCSWPDCHELDFLPIVCGWCEQNLCKQHFLPEQHSCSSLHKSEIADVGRMKKGEKYKCSVVSCSKWELAPLLCSACQGQVCVEHRFQDSHDCPSLAKPKLNMPKTKALVQNIINSHVSTSPAPVASSKKSLAAQKTAAKVQLMKLKMKSVGLASLPEAERTYFLVQPPASADSLGCFVSNRWSLGKVVDTLAEATKTPNRNNQTGAKKLAIFRSTGEQLVEPMNSLLSDLLSTDKILNGEAIRLDYVD